MAVIVVWSGQFVNPRNGEGEAPAEPHARDDGLSK